MITIQIAIGVRGNDDNTIEVVIEECADTNDAERRIAEQFQEVMRAGLEGLRDRLPAGEVIITEKEA
jgi:hypothetical protein